MEGVSQVVADRPSHVACLPRGLASIDFWLRIPYYCLLDSVTVKLTCERLQSGTGWPGVWQVGHPLCPLVSGLRTLPPRVRYIPGVTLILVEFQISL
jgi:hypothetical protein